MELEESILKKPQLIVIKTILNMGTEARHYYKYAQIIFEGEEIGFINDEGIFLKMFSKQIKTGVYKNICKFLEGDFR